MRHTVQTDGPTVPPLLQEVHDILPLVSSVTGGPRPGHVPGSSGVVPPKATCRMLAPNTSLSGQLRFRLFSVSAILMGTLYHLAWKLSRVGCTVSAPSGRDHPPPMSQVPACQPGGGRSAGVHFDWPKWTKSHLGGNALSDSFPHFLSWRNWAQRSASPLPGWQGKTRKTGRSKPLPYAPIWVSICKNTQSPGLLPGIGRFLSFWFLNTEEPATVCGGGLHHLRHSEVFHQGDGLRHPVDVAGVVAATPKGLRG